MFRPLTQQAKVRSGVCFVTVLAVAVLWASGAVAPAMAPLPTPAGRAAASGAPAYPGAEGAGAASRGGRGGRVFIVSTLADSGRGSLRECVEAAGPRTCTFAVAGAIVLKTTLYVTNPFLTVAGQTAPGGGVQLTNSLAATERDLSVLVLVSTHDVVWTYTRLRNRYRAACSNNKTSECGGLFGIESARGRNVYNVIASNNSLSWNQDEGFDIWNGAGRPIYNVTMSMNLIAEGLDSHSTGMLTGGGGDAKSRDVHDIDFIQNLVMNNSHRNPLMLNKSGRIINNIFYNQYYYVSEFGGGGSFDIVGNYYGQGPLSRKDVGHEVLAYSSYAKDPVDGAPSLFMAGNLGWNQAEPDADQDGMTRRVWGENGVEIGPLPSAWRRLLPLPGGRFPIVAEPVSAIVGARGHIAPLVGASRRLDCAGDWAPARDEVDARLVRQYVEDQGVSVLPRGSEPHVQLPTLPAGRACADEDRDGMPDDWERARFGDLSQAPGEDADHDGFTNIEAYLYRIPAQ